MVKTLLAAANIRFSTCLNCGSISTPNFLFFPTLTPKYNNLSTWSISFSFIINFLFKGHSPVINPCVFEGAIGVSMSFNAVSTHS